jgi:hypothetical protein
MNFQKYIQDLINYQYMQGEAEEVEEYLVIAA